MATRFGKSPGVWRSAFRLVLGFCVALSACGLASNSPNPSGAPEFVSTPGTAATQGIVYTYLIHTTPAIGTVTLSLESSPTGATLAGDTLTWTPSAAQSRVPNQFSVTATDTSGTATQSWTVTPSGTVTGTLVYTSWTSKGPVAQPFDWTKSQFSPPAALPAQPDGSFKALQGSGKADGTFGIPEVPGGYYWLRVGARAYWTSSSTFDLGWDVNAPSTTSLLSSSPTTIMHFDVSGLDPLQNGDEIQFMLWNNFVPFTIPFLASSPAGATNFNLTETVTSNLDFSQPNPAFLLQYEPETIGPLSAKALGPSKIMDNFVAANGVSNTFSETLAASPQKSVELNIEGSAWAALFNKVGPAPAQLMGADLEVAVQPYMPAGDKISEFPQDIPLLVDLQSIPGSFPVMFTPSVPVCEGEGSIPFPGSQFTLPGEPPVTANQDFGIASFEDPFPADWPRVFSFCETAMVAVPLPGSPTPISFLINNYSNTALPASPSQISPPFGTVQDPTIDGADFFTAQTIHATKVDLSWTAPSGVTPTGYDIIPCIAITLPGGPLTYFPEARFYTAKTSASLPPLQTGKTYVFVIIALLDGAANFETSPNRSALPTAAVSVVSAPMTLTSP